MCRLTLVLVLLVMAGCAGPASDVAGTETQTVTPAPTPTPVTATPTESSTQPPNATAENTVDYAHLTPEAQAAFDAAVQSVAKFLPDSPYVEDEFFRPATAAEFQDVEFVRMNGTYYTVDVSPSGELYASYRIQAEPGSPGENDTVVAHGTFSAAVSSEVKWAIENGSYRVPLGKWDSLPHQLSGAEYVRYDGETYRMSYGHGDYWVTVMEARPA